MTRKWTKRVLMTAAVSCAATAALAQSSQQYKQFFFPDDSPKGAVYVEWNLSNFISGQSFFPLKEIAANINRSRSPSLFTATGSRYQYGLSNQYSQTERKMVRVNDHALMIAHRGIVDLYNGINENTLDAVQNAVKNKVFMIELDIQATKDGVPVVTHDDNLSRTIGVNKNIKDVNWSEIASHNTKIKHPDGTLTNDAPYYCISGAALMTLPRLDAIMQGTQQNAGYNGRSCEEATGITFFLDPKNLRSGKAAVQYIADSGRSGSLGKRRFYMKTYDDFWGPDDGTSDRTQAFKAAGAIRQAIPTAFTSKSIKVMPVIKIRDYLDADQDILAVNYAVGIVRSWADQGFEVAAVEFPGAWDVKWKNFVEKFYARLDADPTIYKNNPVDYYTDKDSVVRKMTLPPVLSYGYRFPDFKVGDQSYTWSMQGKAQVDNSTINRRRLGMAAHWARLSCQLPRRTPYADYTFNTDTSAFSVMSLTGCFVTTDFPVQEAYINFRQTYSNFVGAPQTTFPVGTIVNPN